MAARDFKTQAFTSFFYILPSTFPVAYKTVGSPDRIFWRKGSCAGQRGRKYKGKQDESSIEVGG